MPRNGRGALVLRRRPLRWSRPGAGPGSRARRTTAFCRASRSADGLRPAHPACGLVDLHGLRRASWTPSVPVHARRRPSRRSRARPGAGSDARTMLQGKAVRRRPCLTHRPQLHETLERRDATRFQPSCPPHAVVAVRRQFGVRDPRERRAAPSVAVDSGAM